MPPSGVKGTAHFPASNSLLSLVSCRAVSCGMYVCMHACRGQLTRKGLKCISCSRAEHYAARLAVCKEGVQDAMVEVRKTKESMRRVRRQTMQDAAAVAAAASRPAAGTTGAGNEARQSRGRVSTSSAEVLADGRTRSRASHGSAAGSLRKASASASASASARFSGQLSPASSMGSRGPG